MLFETVMYVLATSGSVFFHPYLQSVWAIVLGTGVYLLWYKQAPRLVPVFSGVLLLSALVVTHVAAARIGSTDPSIIILDEIAAIPFLFVFLSPERVRKPYWYIAVSVLLFAFFDSIKPLGASYVERLPGGFGIVGDDVYIALIIAVFVSYIYTVTLKHTLMK